MSDPANPSRYFAIRGRVTHTTTEGDAEHIESLAQRYLGGPYPWDLRLMAKDGTRAWIVDPGDPLTPRVWEAARTCHTALGCRDYSLFDFRIDPSGRPWFLEAGLYCSFARSSVIPMMAAAAGIPLDGLFRTAVEEALARGR